MVNNITIQELLKLNKSSNIIDIRGIESFNNGHIDGARNIPYNLLLVNPQKYLVKNELYYVYCQRGTKSVKLCQYLNSKGYKTVNVLGGYESWILLK